MNFCSIAIIGMPYILNLTTVHTWEASAFPEYLLLPINIFSLHMIRNAYILLHLLVILFRLSVLACYIRVEC